ncbi:MAG: 4-hydroxy-tetrahydrodipicolinate reductase [Defluviitaleaceae bacterium]|nr:4-hydroxy-tetrahydrodipicolinate reductase [Defluviitaleaceae bacterium]
MTRIIVCGCLGRLGATICKLAVEEPGVEIAAGIDILSGGESAFPIYGEISQCNPADVVISCLPPTAEAEIVAVLGYCAAKKLPIVMCTTGLSDLVEKMLVTASEASAVLRAPNLSLGINLLANMLNRAARILYDASFDIEIIEKHHNQKLDAPSGTAIMLAETINAALDGQMRMVTDRSREKSKRARNEIGLHALRGGSFVGEHSIVFAGQNETVEFTHIASSRDAFAVGALKAARYISGKPPGLYTMQNLINDF